MSPSVGLNDLNAGVGDLWSMLATAIVLLQPCVTQSSNCWFVCHLTAKFTSTGGGLLTFWRVWDSAVSGNDFAVRNWHSHKIPHKNHWYVNLSFSGLLETRYKKKKAKGEGGLVSYLEFLGLSGQANRVHHGDEDGYVTQGAAHAACYTDPQRIIRTFSELHCPRVLMLWSWGAEIKKAETSTWLQWIDGYLPSQIAANSWYSQSWLVLSGSTGRFPESEHVWEAALELPVSLIWNRSTQRCYCLLSHLFSRITEEWFPFYSKPILGWEMDYLTALRQPSLRVEGSSFKPPHLQLYRPHAALQHRIYHIVCPLVSRHTLKQMLHCTVRQSQYLEQRRHGFLSGRPDVLAVDWQDLVALCQPAISVHQTSFHNIRHKHSCVIPGVGQGEEKGVRRR